MDDGRNIATGQVLKSIRNAGMLVSQEKEWTHRLSRTQPERNGEWRPATTDPLGPGFAGILTSEMFGLGSDLDRPTLSLLHSQALLAGKDTLEGGETAHLREKTGEIEALGFQMASSDPYCQAFLEGVAKRARAAPLSNQRFPEPADMTELAEETDQILAEIEAEEAEERRATSQ